ncbi:DUF2301 domain-containing membrane protein [Aestuariirhabdus litorea]|uniref:Uncharacterized protein n=1 Tax=Aestuariirhabdus litorea TaxID=2528527 RepID=A0A3P3VWW2_9GAMM|nr:DUF2301 domain-containing membrane protein [Aestuariirhabdus litorea]RRJ85193.1 hypothetical protein D0544_09040 [Aestuariirhabdus litorea]RWW98414.1 hypothetical protein DZC74_09025 [Endozoicomonadaceae bacterium GTF-13]
MADPNVIATLDAFDRTLVRIYRTGISLAALYLLSAVGHWAGQPLAPFRQALLMLAATLMASSLHLYDKRIRYALLMSTLLGLLWAALAPRLGVPALPLLVEGLLLVTLSGVAFKESHCFRVVGLRWVPLLLLAMVLARAAGSGTLAVSLSLVAGGLMGYLALRKWQMPLHYDIGDRSKYQN